MSEPAAYIAPFRDLLPPNARLLVQAGAGDGGLARAYRKLYPASGLMVVEADPALAAQAREYADRVYQADLDSVSAAFYQQLAWADGWYFDATLEQCQQPGRVLQQVGQVMPVDTCIIARIANRSHWQAPETPPQHQWDLAGMLTLFAGSGLRVISGILLNPGPLPAEVEARLREQAGGDDSMLAALVEATQPSHYLIKAVPER